MSEVLAENTQNSLQAIPRVPTREQIERLHEEVAKLPQTEVDTQHFFVPGMYCRRVLHPAGVVIVGKVHKAPHFFLCASGEVMCWSEKGMLHLKPGDVIESKPGTKRAAYALVDAVIVTIHKTDLTDLDAIEEELIEPDEKYLFDSNNKLKKAVLEGTKALEVV